MTNVKYDQHYSDDAAACGAPFGEFVDFCDGLARGSVLDLGCGQGRDALMFASAGHRVVGVDISSVGVRQMLARARAHGLDVQGVVGDLVAYRPPGTFDVVVLDRVLHMLAGPDRRHVLDVALSAVSVGGFLLVAEGPKGLQPVVAAVTSDAWRVARKTKNRLIVQRVAAG